MTDAPNYYVFIAKPTRLGRLCLIFARFCGKFRKTCGSCGEVAQKISFTPVRMIKYLQFLT